MHSFQFSISSSVRMSINVCALRSCLPGIFTGKHFTFRDRKHTFVISINDVYMRSVMATVLFWIHVQNHAQKCRYSSHENNSFLLTLPKRGDGYFCFTTNPPSRKRYGR